MLKVGSLFSGYGGLDLATQPIWPTSELVWVSDPAPGPKKVLEYRFPGVINLGDITKIDIESIPKVDILTGGSPCQDLSHAGKRLGMTSGTRSNLWVLMREVIAYVKPQIVVWENVLGSLSAQADSSMEHCERCMGDTEEGTTTKHLRALGRVLGDLAELRYNAAWTSLPASDVGACHRRKRVFVVATHPSGEGGGQGDAWGLEEKYDPTPRNPRDTSTKLNSLQLLPTPAASNPNDSEPLNKWLERREQVKNTRVNGNGMGTPLSIAIRGEYPYNNPNSNIYGKYSQAIARHEEIFGRLSPHPLDFLTTASVEGRLSPPFVEWMMGLPEGWITDIPGITRSNQIKLLGNGVIPRQAEEGIRRCITALKDMSLSTN